jgi:adenylylsulfate kinase-like enzyme
MKVGNFEYESNFVEKTLLSQRNATSILNTLNILVQLNKEIGFIRTKENILNNIIAEANYSSLVTKDGTVNTVRILGLLSESQKHTLSMENKDLITFFGSTGSGKSTSVNYFMGVPLEKYVNNFGDHVIRIN